MVLITADSLSMSSIGGYIVVHFDMTLIADVQAINLTIRICINISSLGDLPFSLSTAQIVVSNLEWNVSTMTWISLSVSAPVYEGWLLGDVPQTTSHRPHRDGSVIRFLTSSGPMMRCGKYHVTTGSTLARAQGRGIRSYDARNDPFGVE